MEFLADDQLGQQSIVKLVGRSINHQVVHIINSIQNLSVFDINRSVIFCSKENDLYCNIDRWSLDRSCDKWANVPGKILSNVPILGMINL